MKTMPVGPTSAIVSPPTEKPVSSSFLVNIPPFRPLSISSQTNSAALICDSSTNLYPDKFYE